MKANKNLSYIEYELYKNDDSYFGLTAFYKGYGFSLEIVNLDTDEIVFKKFLKTQDIDYCGNYLRKVVRNNFGARIA